MSFPDRLHRSDVLPLLLAAAGWAVLLGVRYAFPWLYLELWIMAVGVELLAGGVALGCTVIAMVWSWRRGGRAASVWLATGMLALAVVVAPPVWSRVHATTWYQFHRAGFTEVAELAREDRLGPSLTEEYYGAILPSRYRSLSLNGRVAVVGTDGRGQPVLFVPAWIGAPDDAGGFVHLTSPLPYHRSLDLFGRFARPAFPLGGGWWWV